MTNTSKALFRTFCWLYFTYSHDNAATCWYCNCCCYGHCCYSWAFIGHLLWANLCAKSHVHLTPGASLWPGLLPELYVWDSLDQQNDNKNIAPKSHMIASEWQSRASNLGQRIPKTLSQSKCHYLITQTKEHTKTSWSTCPNCPSHKGQNLDPIPCTLASNSKLLLPLNCLPVWWCPKAGDGQAAFIECFYLPSVC